MTHPSGHNHWSQIDEGLAHRERQTVVEIISRGRTEENALEVGLSALILTEHLFRLVEGENSLPRPLVCRAACSFCCYNQIELTPPEALLLGDYIGGHFSAGEKSNLREKIERLDTIKAGLSKVELARNRREFPCPLLRDELCAAYPARPLTCRAMHSLDAGKCEISLQSEEFIDDEYYLHRHTIVNSIIKGLLDGCRAMGCQAGSLNLIQALKSVLTQPRPAVRWIQGNAVFPGL